VAVTKLLLRDAVKDLNHVSINGIVLSAIYYNALLHCTIMWTVTHLSAC